MTNKQIVEELREKIFTAIGEASMCWEPRPTGVFDSTAAEKIGNRLADEILSRMEAEDKAVEPLAVLAVKKGWPRIHITEFRGLWYFSLWEYMATNPATKEPFSGTTYASAEAKAREYLNALPDKGLK